MCGIFFSCTYLSTLFISWAILQRLCGLCKKFSKAESNITGLKSLGATVLHGIDVKTMKLHTELKNRRFDRIVFNFPHAGFKGKESEVYMIKYVRYLVVFSFAVNYFLDPVFINSIFCLLS